MKRLKYNEWIKIVDTISSENLDKNKKIIIKENFIFENIVRIYSKSLRSFDDKELENIEYLKNETLQSMIKKYDVNKLIDIVDMFSYPYNLFIEDNNIIHPAYDFYKNQYNIDNKIINKYNEDLK